MRCFPCWGCWPLFSRSEPRPEQAGPWARWRHPHSFSPWGSGCVGNNVASVSETARSVLGRSFLNHADLFAFGLGLAVLMVEIGYGAVRLPAWWRIPTYGMLAALVFATMLLVDRGLIYTFIGAVPYELLTGTAAALLLALVALPSTNHSS